MTVLEAQKREAGVKLGILRKEGQIPAVIYGAGKSSMPVAVLGTAFIKIHKGGETTPISIKTPEGVVDAMIQDIAYDPITLSPIHVDFLAIDVNKEIEAKIPLEFIGEAPAAKSGLGALVKVMHEIEVLALPKNLPHHIEVSLEKLATLEDHIFVSDLKVPISVKIITPADEVIASVAAIKEEVLAPAGPIDLSTIEVVKKGKKEEEGEGEAAATA